MVNSVQNDLWANSTKITCSNNCVPVTSTKLEVTLPQFYHFLAFVPVTHLPDMVFNLKSWPCPWCKLCINLFLTLFSDSPCFFSEVCLPPHSQWINTSNSYALGHCRHYSALRKFSVIAGFCFHNANPKFALFLQLYDNFSQSTSLTKSRGLLFGHCWHHSPSNLCMYSTLPLQRNQMNSSISSFIILLKSIVFLHPIYQSQSSTLVYQSDPSL